MTSTLLALALVSPQGGWACSSVCLHSPAEPMMANVAVAKSPKSKMNLLVFSRTTGFRHDSIETGVKALTALGEAHQFSVDWTEDPTQFTAEKLAKYKTVVFLNTTGDILNATQEAAFEKFIADGGGYVGVHSAADTEYDWGWYGKLVGAYFKSHPQIQQATVKVLDRTHPSTKHLGATWNRTDEWYDYKAVPADTVKILMALDTTTYQGHQMGGNHPIAWCHEVGKGRAWYTGGGHTRESYSEEPFLKHLLGGIEWASRKKLSE